MALGPAALLLALTRPADGVSIARDPRQGIMFTSHHKTGTVLSLELEVCFVGGHNASSNMRQLARRCKESRTLDDLNWNGFVPSDCARLVHFVRTPREIVRSGYLYHRKVPAVEIDRFTLFTCAQCSQSVSFVPGPRTRSRTGAPSSVGALRPCPSATLCATRSASQA